MNNLNGKKIIVTAGPVWVPIDKVRIITNVFGGALGYEIANEAARQGAEVILLMGPGRVHFTGKEKFKLIKFKYYDEIYKILKKEISSKKYSAIIQSAAIPDYVPVETKSGKIKSGKKELVLKFKPTKKMIDEFRKWDEDIFIVKFKLEVDKNKKELVEIAYKSMLYSKADLMVANQLDNIGTNHEAYLMDPQKNIKTIIGKNNIARELVKEIQKRLN
ncbi:MAG: phosphopantothenoylcysteine decarboxylase [Patescibacteria group bacterium]|nr:phosphopantothenoylcysteine decarboxylase [Patescibacteria group bacterium]MDD4611219.1 phosphopantothenoylcysteine decarboxylase [Patescibacteria group bacterium]